MKRITILYILAMLLILGGGFLLDVSDYVLTPILCIGIGVFMAITAPMLNEIIEK